jgi:hypothetical protein
MFPRVMTATRVLVGLLLVLVILTVEAEAQRVYRWVDEEGNAHYAGTRNDVPERYRSQLPPDAPPADMPREPGRCALAIRTPPARGFVTRRDYPDCDTCMKVIEGMGPQEAAMARCIKMRE